MTTKAQVSIDHTRYEARRSARFLARDSYGRYIRPFMELIATRTEGHEYLRTGMQMVATALERGESGTAMWLLAAVVELIEPDEKTPEIAEAQP